MTYRQSDPPDVGNIEDDELRSGNRLLVWLPWEALPIRGRYLSCG